MSRQYCNKCGRAQRGCICRFSCSISNTTPITIIRHPSEVKNIKGTAKLLELSLSNLELKDCEEISKEELIKIGFRNILVFPSEESIPLADFVPSTEVGLPLHLIFIDGTWKKAYKILQLNPYLKEIPHLNLQVDDSSIYSEIRKQRSGGLSTLESVVHVLRFIESDLELEALESEFLKFIQHIKEFTH